VGSIPTLATLEIRKAERSDAPLLLELITELAAYEKAAERVVGDSALLEESLFDRKAAEALILVADGEVAGYAIFFTTFSTWECRPGIWLEDVYVRPQMRRQGIGLAVLSHIAAIAVERGCARFEWTALDWNEPALSFYEQIGAVPVEGWTTHRLEGEGLRELARRR
jgi:GNAT superfamily N-acetyltransferase